MTVDEAKAFVKQHGIVLESAHGTVPSVAQFIAGVRITGSWWGHPKGEAIFMVTRALRDDSDLLVCRLVDGKVTYIHRRVWPALVRLASQFDTSHLAAIVERHTEKGKHVVKEKPFPDWVPADVQQAATNLSQEQARNVLAKVL